MIGLMMLFAIAAAEPAITPESHLEQAQLRQLLTIRRVYIDRLNGGETAAQMRDMIITALQNSKLFVLTEREDRADAILRGSAEDLVFSDVHNSSESINAHANFGVSRSSRSRDSGGVGVGENESTHTSERRHEAAASVRLVNKEGDVIWSTTQESLGGKFRGSSADVADKIAKRLSEDCDRARTLPPVK
jgi:hypothetical protein